MSEPILALESVTRRFGRRTALDAVTIRVDPGTVVGLLGRNGAGKTTALRLANGLLFPDAGRVRVLGLDPSVSGVEVRRQASLLSEESSLHGWMTVGEVLAFGAALHPGWDETLARRLSERLDLDRRVRISGLSRGGRAKVSLVLAVAVRPRLLLLDDPTAGLDPLVRREVLEGVLEAVPAEGGSVVYASHLIHDVERIADRVAFLDDGRLVLDSELERVKAETHRVTAVFDAAPPDGLDLAGAIDVRRSGRSLVWIERGDPAALARRAKGWGAGNVTVEPQSLEEILIAFLRDPAAKETHDA